MKPPFSGGKLKNRNYVYRFIASVILTALTLTSCSGNDSAPSSTQREVSLFHEAINMPDTASDRLISEIRYTNAIEDSIFECMNDRGFQYVVQHSDPNEYIESFGTELTAEDYAKQFGFGILQGATNINQFHSDSHNQPEQSEAYITALGADPSSVFGEVDIKAEGCKAEAYSSVEPPQWFRYVNWLGEVASMLRQRVQADQRFKVFEQQWAECMSEFGYDEWDSQWDLRTSLGKDFTLALVRIDNRSAENDPFSDLDLAALDNNSVAILDDFVAREIELAVASYNCTEESRNERNRIREELEREILKSNPPPN